ncbi:MAG: hypothetical protein IJL47_05535 [Lachnospiraceae bacterium]|nr:hypothetical protein [Lachnospiraceae bacterium]MBQ6196934.1 hypothetical protein [Lachnospiraceae bacterium]
MNSIRNKEMVNELKAIRNEEILNLPDGEYVLYQSSKTKAHKKTVRHRAALAVMSLALLCIGVLAMNPKAYAAVSTWIKGIIVEKATQIGDHYSIIDYELPLTSDKTAAYRFAWVPERFHARRLLESESSLCDYAEEYSYEIPSVNPGELPKAEKLAIGYVYLSGEAAKTYFIVESKNLTLLENGKIESGSYSGEFFCYKNTGFTSADGFFDGFWVDTESGVAFRLSGDISKEEAFKIIENVQRIR